MKRATVWLLVCACGATRQPPNVVAHALDASSPPDPDAAVVLDAGSADVSVGPVVRERQTITVDGVVEEWRLEWLGPPSPSCVPEKENLSCHCDGLAYGEIGNLELVRARPGVPDERLAIHQQASRTGAFQLRRWPVFPTDSHADGGIDYATRPLSKVMSFRDYDHDGRATEFVLQVAGPFSGSGCGRYPTAVVWISKANPRLHFFASVETPDEPLILYTFTDWKSVAANVDVDITLFECGSYGMGLSDVDPCDANEKYPLCGKDRAIHVHADGELHVTNASVKCSSPKSRTHKSSYDRGER